MADLATHTHTHFCPFSLCRCETWHGRSGHTHTHTHTRTHTLLSFFAVQVRDMAWQIWQGDTPRFEPDIRRLPPPASKMPLSPEAPIQGAFSSHACVLSKASHQGTFSSHACKLSKASHQGPVQQLCLCTFRGSMFPRTVYIYGSGQPYLYAVVLINVTTKVKSQHI